VHVVLLGAPGSGKGTQGAVVARHLGVPHVSSGELLRAEVASGSELGRKIGDRIALGELVPDDLVLAVVGDALTGAAKAGGYVLDGIPRTLAQAERAYALAKPAGLVADAVIYLEVPDDVARERLAGRAETGRADDADPTVIERRLQIFHADTGPLLDFYRERGILITIDAEQSMGAVSDAILTALRS
jgi:adenylate kinase